MPAIFTGAASERTLYRRSYMGVYKWSGNLGACLFPVCHVGLVSDSSLCETACRYTQRKGLAFQASDADRSFEK
ncbi:MAG: hypothetical protein U0N82_06765 [Oscillospiraceae bacterium]